MGSAGVIAPCCLQMYAHTTSLADICRCAVVRWLSRLGMGRPRSGMALTATALPSSTIKARRGGRCGQTTCLRATANAFPPIAARYARLAVQRSHMTRRRRRSLCRAHCVVPQLVPRRNRSTRTIGHRSVGSRRRIYSPSPAVCDGCQPLAFRLVASLGWLQILVVPQHLPPRRRRTSTDYRLTCGDLRETSINPWLLGWCWDDICPQLILPLRTVRRL